nr:MAG TPA: hypothetical protein [Caudoviricetes sp.]
MRYPCPYDDADGRRRKPTNPQSPLGHSSHTLRVDSTSADLLR